jgi:hypothetical protein
VDYSSIQRYHTLDQNSVRRHRNLTATTHSAQESPLHAYTQISGFVIELPDYAIGAGVTDASFDPDSPLSDGWNHDTLAHK